MTEKDLISKQNIIDNFVMYFSKVIADEQPDARNIDYRLPKTNEIYNLIFDEIWRIITQSAQAQQFSSGKSQPVGDTGSPKSYKRWEKMTDNLLAREHFKGF